MAAVIITVLLAFGALAIDIANLYVVRNELQNAADAAVLAGAQCLYPRAECANLGSTVPDWNTAQQRATNGISLNQSQGVTLTNGVVEHGYWNLTGTPAGLQPLPMTPTANDVPGLQVTVRKAPGENGGSVVLYMAGLLGISDAIVSARAVSVVTSAGSVGPSGLFPFVMTKCMFDTYWDSASDAPKTATSTSPLPGQTLPQTIGQPYVFQITSGYHVGACDGADWTSFALDRNDVPTIGTLIASGNPTTLSLGDQTWIEPGTKTTLYNTVNACSAAGDKSCELVTIAVVNTALNHSDVPIKAFACLRIVSATGGSGKYVTVQMSNKCVNPDAGGTGPDYGVHSTAKLAS